MTALSDKSYDASLKAGASVRRFVTKYTKKSGNAGFAGITTVTGFVAGLVRKN